MKRLSHESRRALRAERQTCPCEEEMVTVQSVILRFPYRQSGMPENRNCSRQHERAVMNLQSRAR